MKIKLSDNFNYKKLLRFTLPTIVMMIFTSIYGVVDGFFISNFVDETAFTAVNVVYPFLMVLGAVGFMIGSFVGSAVGSFAYTCGYNAVMSFCIDTGFTMFGIVKHDYTLPEDVIENLGVELFRYESFLPKQFSPKGFTHAQFNARGFEADTIGVHILSRGVIGVAQIGYI